MTTCKLCNSSSKLLKSHAIPNAVFKKIFRQDSWKEEMFCASCEQLFSIEYEKYSLEILRGVQGTYKYHDLGVTFSGVDSKKLNGFFVSVFWRAANSAHPAYEEIHIPEPWNDQIRNFLLRTQWVPRNLVSIKLTRLIDYTPCGFSLDVIKSMIMIPFSRRNEYGTYSFAFLFEGYFVEIYMPGLKGKDRKQQGVLGKDKKTLLIPYVDIFKIPEVLECLVKSYGKIANDIESKKANKFAKCTSFVSLTARDAFSTRPLQRR